MPGFNIPLLGDGLKMPWGDIRLIIDFFLGGLGVGAFIIAFVARLIDKERYQGVTKAGAYIAPVAVIIGLLLLMSDAGVPTRFLTAFFRTHAASATSWGTFLQGFLVVFLLIYAWVASRPEGAVSESAELAIGWIALILAALTAPYHGYVMATMTGREFWSNAMVPTLFMTISISTGIAIVTIFSAGEAPEVQVSLGKALAIILGIQLVVLITQMSLAPTLSAGVKAAASVLINNVWLFWIGILLIGMIAPLIIDITAVRGEAAAATGTLFLVSLLVLVGGFLLRYGIIIAGQSTQLTP